MIEFIKTEQYQHQREIFESHRDDEYFALFWEMGLGKTKVMIDVASYQFAIGGIHTLVVIAPNSVYGNWIEEEIPIHMAVPHIMMKYPKSNTKRDKARREIFLDRNFKSDHLKILAMSYDSVNSIHGFEFAKRVFSTYPAMIIADESTAIKSPSTKRSRRSKVLSGMAEYKWIATGTPVSQSPFDVHSQIEFLDENFWKDYGLKTFNAFKNEFGEFTLRSLGNGRKFNELRGYRRLESLKKIISPISSRLLKEDSSIQLPPKSYAIRTFDMTPEQEAMYEQICNEYEAELDDGMVVDGTLGIVRLARLQQIACGFVTAQGLIEADEEDMLGLKIKEVRKELKELVSPHNNPRIKLMVDILNECSHKVIIWVKFRRDIQNIEEVLGNRCMVIDGSVNQRDRDERLKRFKDPEDPAQALVINIATINQGLTLTIAKTMIYYSNSFNLERRLQSEDRNHRIGQDSPVLVIDIAARKTVDRKIINGLREKFNIAAQVTGDRFREWIKPE